MRGPTLAKVAVALLAAASLPAVSGGAGADDDGAGFGPIDVVFDCNELVPESLSPFAGLVEPSEEIPVDVLVLVDDSVTVQRAEQVMQQAASAYLPLNVVLQPTYGEIGLSSADAWAAIETAKAKLGGTRQGHDIVHVMTHRDLFVSLGPLGDQQAVAGLADCIGGIRWDNHAFSVSEAARHTVEIEAEIVAHEIGHLFGAHHHYANCAEATCTLMFNDAGLTSLHFSTLSAAVVRGHACFYPDAICESL